MLDFIGYIGPLSPPDDWETDLMILEEEMFLNDYFDRYGVFQIEEY